MSLTTWTRCGGEASFRRLRARAWRIVEGQHVIATRKLVDSTAEHELLEQLIDGVKLAVKPAVNPAVPDNLEFRGQHYLLSTPFRYPPLKYGSRFGGRHERGLWYGSVTEETALAETAFYRLLFLAGTHADLGEIVGDYSSFRVRIDSSRAIDLASLPDRDYRALLTKASYSASQEFGRSMREASGEVLRFPSVRDPKCGSNFAIWTPAVFRDRQPDRVQSWAGEVSTRSVVFHRIEISGPVRIEFSRSDFDSGGRLQHVAENPARPFP